MNTNIVVDQVYDKESAKEIWAMLHGFKEGFAAAHQVDEPHILLQACCVINDYIRLLEKLDVK